MNNYVLDKEDILYVPLSEKYIEDYLLMVNDVSVSKFISKTIKTYSYEDEQAWIKKKLETNATIFTMIEKKSKKFIGIIELMNITTDSAELGISITSSMQNKHYGTKGIQTLIDYGFNTLNLKEITLVVFSINEKAIHCYKKLGFKEYKVVKDVAIIDNQHVDDIHMKLVRKI